MPALAAAVTAVVGAGAVSAPLAFAYGALAYAGAYATLTYALNKAAASMARKGKGGGGGLEVSTIDSASAGRVLYGKVRIGGVNVIPPLTSGSSGQYLHQVLAIAVHECDGFSGCDVYLDDKQVAAANITGVSGVANDGLVTGGDFSGVAWLKRYAGTTSQNVDYHLNLYFPSSFGSTFRGRGVTYLAAMLDWGNGKKFTGGVPAITTEVRGKKCYDPRLDASPGADPTNPAFAAWTQCPALVWADYKMSSTYGQKAIAAEIDWDCVADAADVCDALVSIPGGTQPRYTFNGVLTTDSDTAENERMIIDSMLGKRSYTDGKWRIFAGAWRTAAYEIDKEDWMSIGAIRTTAPRGEDRFNGVVVYHIDSARNWQRVESYRRYNDTYKSADGGERVWVELEQPACLSKYEAERKGEFLLRQSRNGIVLTGTLPPRFMRLRTWDNVALYFDDLGWTAKTFTVSSCAVNPDGSIEVTLIEEQSGDWTDLSSGDYGSPSASTIPTTNPTTPSEPSSFNVTSLLGTLQFDFGEPLIRPLGMRYQVLRSPGTLAVAGSYSVAWEGDVTRIVLPADPRSLYWYHGRSISNSYVSALTANTFGVAAAPWIPAESVPGNRAYPDGEFVYTISSYWELGARGTGLTAASGSMLVTSDGVSPSRGKFVWRVTSGVTGGTGKQYQPMRWDIDSKTSDYGPRALPGQQGVAYLVYRSINSHYFSINAAAAAYLPSSSGAQPAEASVTLNLASTIGSLANSGEWVTQVFTFVMPSSNYDHVRFYVRGPTSYVDSPGTLEIGAMQVTLL